MSDLTDRIAAEHFSRFFDCSCGHNITPPHSRSTTRLTHADLFGRHIAQVTEAAVRAQIAADIQAKIDEPFGHEDHWWPGLVAAARIAEGGAS